ncbi:Type II secretion system (T2SS), protein F [uncultured archaeon]|nr:Type II secretion system (T2SS), protein F [uncultured archaeon]
MDSLEKFLSIVCAASGGMQAFGHGSSQKISGQFFAAGLDSIDAGKYLSGSLFVSISASLLLFAASLPFIPLLDSVSLLFLSLASVFSCFYSLPYALSKRRMALAESELPFLLRELAIYVDVGLPFEKAVAKIAARKYALSPEFSRVVREVKAGSTMPSALAALSSRAASLPVKRCMLLLSSLYETGSGTEPLKRTAEELSSSQLSSMRTQSGKLSLLAIVFIACSALIPAFFTVFAAVSPAISSSQIPSWQVWLAFIVVFPLVNVASLALMFFLLPPAPSSSSGGSPLGEYLAKKGFSFGVKSFIILFAAVSALLCGIFLFLSQATLALLSVCIAPMAYAIAAYAAGMEIDEAEAHLPDALYSAASTHRLLSAEKMLSYLSKGGFGRLSESFALALRRLEAGDSFAASMKAAAAHCPSPLVERSFSLLTVSYETGANMYSALREAAADVVSFFSLVRERSAQLAVQRYTILAASAALVPVILGMVVSLAPALSSASALSGSQNESLAPTLALACPLYLLLSCAVSSILLSLAETSPRRAVLYFAFTAPVSQAVFSMASAGAFSFVSG